jgi:pimeloyl-ACP methyl ester carboxylesterase
MQTLKLDGRKLAYETTGDGPVTVLLETGLGAESNEWAPVADALKHHARVLWYDRANRGASDQAPGPRRVQAMRDDLDALIKASGVRPPFLLVGHSFGGLLMRAFARDRRAEIRGLLLVESMHPRQFDLLGPLFPASDDSDTKTLADMRELWQQAWKHPESTPEHIDFADAFAQDRIEAGALASLPVCVLSAASWSSAPFIADEHIRETLQSQWNALQAELARLSDQTQSVYLEQSSHFVQRDQPDAIAHAALALLAASVDASRDASDDAS